MNAPRLTRSLLAAAVAGSLVFAGAASAQQADRSAQNADRSAQQTGRMAQDTDRSDRTTAANTESNQPMSDTWITTKVKAALLAERDVSGLAITVETANGIVSLSGDVDNRAQIDRATAVARDIEGVRSVDAQQLVVNTSRDRSARSATGRTTAQNAANREHNTAAGRTGAGHAADHANHTGADRSDRTAAANIDSDQPMSDTWITTKVKAALLAESDVSGLDISVETANGTVSLSGDVASQAQIQRATSIARGIEGVRTVDTKQLRVQSQR